MDGIFEVLQGSECAALEALRQSVGREAVPTKGAKSAKKPRKSSAGQKEMPMPIQGKKQAKEAGRRNSRRASAEVGLGC